MLIFVPMKTDARALDHSTLTELRKRGVAAVQSGESPALVRSFFLAESVGYHGVGSMPPGEKDDGPSLRGGGVLVEGSVDDRGSHLEHQMRPSR